MTVYNVTADADVFTCNAYLVTGETTSLIDVGATKNIVEEIHSYTDMLDNILITHQHSDHIQQLDTVVEAFDPEVYAYDDHPLRTREIMDGDTVPIGSDTFRVIYSPGHANDHLVFYSNETIFSGDIVVYSDEAYERGSFGRTDKPSQSRETLIESIERIRTKLPSTVKNMYPGHGEPYQGDVHTIINNALDRAKKYNPKYGQQ
ncbi:MAG: MBL fold metallo-hydrolase [Halobacteriaceae archaeon]